MLFQGEEWGASTPFLYFTDHQDPELGRAVSEGRRSEFAAFGWNPDDVPDPQDPATFERSKLDWTEPERDPHRGILDWHHALLRLRRERPSLRDGRLDLVEVAFDEAARWLGMRHGPIYVACNFAEGTQRVPLPPSASGGSCDVLLASAPEVSVGADGIEVPPDAVAVGRLSG